MKLLDRWLFAGYPTTIGNLAVYRILYATVALLVISPMGLWLRHVPHAFFNPPPSPAAMFRGFPPFALIVALNSLLALSLSALLIGWRTRTASLATAILFVSINSWKYSVCKIEHDLILVTIAPLVLAFSGWGDALSIDARRKRRDGGNDLSGSWAVALFALLIGMAMFTAGWAKLTTGWLQPSQPSTYGHLVLSYYILGSHTWAAEMLLGVQSGWFWKVLDWLVILMESGFLMAAFYRPAFRVFCASACLFHVAVWLLFDMQFHGNVIAYAVVVGFSEVPVSPRARTALATASATLARAPAWALLLAVSCPALAAVLVFGQPLGQLLHLPVCEGVLLLGALVGFGYLLKPLRRQRGRAERGSATAYTRADVAVGPRAERVYQARSGLF